MPDWMVTDGIALATVALAFFFSAYGFPFQALVLAVVGPNLHSWDAWAVSVFLLLASALFGAMRKSSAK